MMTNTHTLSARPPVQSLAGTIKSWWEAYWMMRARRTTVMMLRALDDRCLHDIGVDRSEIESVVYGKPGDRRVRYERH